MSNIARALILLMVGLLFAAGIFFLLPILMNQQQVKTSDATGSKGRIVVAADNFLGYGPICSPRMQQLMLADGYLYTCEDDAADYDSRFKRLRTGDIDFAVSTVDAYIRAGERHNYPGVFAMVIDESRGADGIVASDSVAKNLTDLRGQTGIKVGYTPASPSEHLAKSVGVDFDISALREQSSYVATDGSQDAAKQLLNGNIQVGVLWEPDLSKVLAKPGFVKLMGTEETQGLAVDVLVVNRDYYDDKPDLVRLVMANYFKTLKYYREEPGKFRAHMAAYSNVSKKQVDNMAKGIHWVNLHENATQWMGVSTPGTLPRFGLFDTIGSTIRVMQGAGDVSQNPLPKGDPRRVTNSSVIASLFNEGVSTGASAGASIVTDPLKVDFNPLDANGWNRLVEVGSLKVRPILFESSQTVLAPDDKAQLDQSVESLKTYPHFYIEVQGHTQNRGDAQVNQELSQQRAEVVRSYLRINYGIDTDRIRAIGYGGDRPLVREPGEASRSYQDRLARVEVQLKKEVY